MQFTLLRSSQRQVQTAKLRHQVLRQIVAISKNNDIDFTYKLKRIDKVALLRSILERISSYSSF
jgi:hypothetical protein